MGASPQSEVRMRRWFLIGALVVIGIGTIMLVDIGTSDNVKETSSEVESASDPLAISSDRAPMVLPELSTVESNTDRLVRLIRERLAELNGSLIGSQEWSQLLNEDISAAVRLFEALSDRSQREQLLPSLLKHWVKLDGSSALHWAVQLPDPSEREIALRAGCIGLAESDPKVAVEVVDRLFAGDHREVMLQAVGRLWAVQNLDDAMSWAKTHPHGESRDKLFLEMALVAAESVPEKGAQIAAEYISPGTTQTTAALSVLDRWAQGDFAASTAWANRFPESQARHQAMLRLGRVAFYQSQQQPSGTAPSK
jgi:hypothetical protein